MTTLPFLYGNLEDFTNRIIYYETARGCPYRCSYCLSSIDKQVRFRDLSVVKLELKFFLDHKVHQVKLVDRTFNCNREHALEIWRYLEEHDNGVTNFHFEIAAEILDEDIEKLIEERQAARKEKNFARADEIRDELAAMGIILKDTREGVTWKRA